MNAFEGAKDCEKQSDEELVRLTFDNQDYYACLVSRYEKKLISYIMRLSAGSYEDAEDILQEVFLKAYVNLNDFDKNLKFSSWIYRIAHNETINWWRKNRTRPQTITGETGEKILTLIADKKDFRQEFDRKLTSQNIAKILAKLDLKYKEVLVLKFFEEKDYNEISDILKKPIGTVSTLISRAKQKFKNEAKKQNINFSI